MLKKFDQAWSVGLLVCLSVGLVVDRIIAVMLTVRAVVKIFNSVWGVSTLVGSCRVSSGTTRCLHSRGKN